MRNSNSNWVALLTFCPVKQCKVAVAHLQLLPSNFCFFCFVSRGEFVFLVVVFFLQWHKKKMAKAAHRYEALTFMSLRIWARKVQIYSPVRVTNLDKWMSFFYAFYLFIYFIDLAADARVCAHFGTDFILWEGVSVLFGSSLHLHGTWREARCTGVQCRHQLRYIYMSTDKGETHHGIKVEENLSWCAYVREIHQTRSQNWCTHSKKLYNNNTIILLMYMSVSIFF